jgi:hypothetical protein
MILDESLSLCGASFSLLIIRILKESRSLPGVPCHAIDYVPSEQSVAAREG